MSLFSYGKKLLKSYPWLTRAAAVGFNFFSFNRFKVKRGNKIEIRTSFLKKCRIKVKGKNNEIIFGDKCYLDRCTISIVGNNNKIILGDSVCMHECGLCLENDGGTIFVGDKTLVCGPTHFSCIEGTKITVGADCLFSSDTLLRTGDSHSVLDMDGKRINPAKDICIGDRVWFGTRAMCMKGAALANDSILSAGAILTKAIETSNVVVAGVPAKIVKENVKWCRERI